MVQADTSWATARMTQQRRNSTEPPWIILFLSPYTTIHPMATAVLIEGFAAAYGSK